MDNNSQFSVTLSCGEQFRQFSLEQTTYLGFPIVRTGTKSVLFLCRGQGKVVMENYAI